MNYLYCRRFFGSKSVKYELLYVVTMSYGDQQRPGTLESFCLSEINVFHSRAFFVLTLTVRPKKCTLLFLQ